MKRFILPLSLALLSLILMLGSTESRIKRAAWLGHTVFLPFTRSVIAIKSNRVLKAEVGQLRRDLTISQLQKLQLQNALKESNPQRSIGFAIGNAEFEIAEVIGYSGQFHQRNLLVSKGLADGIRIDSPVISAQGIVGKVVTVSTNHSVILPLSNPQFQVPVMDQATSVQGILQSDLSGILNMNMIRLGSEISAGDTIVTSNLSTLYPKGYPVGTVARIRESQDYLFISAEIRPFTQVENLEHVFILKRRAENE